MHLHLCPPVEAELERFGAFEGHAPATRQLIAQLRRIAATRSSVLIEGETGTGKRLVARELHRHGSKGGLVWLECYRDGERLADANGGTLICEEVASLTLRAQARLVRAVEWWAADVRILAVTREDSAQACERGTFHRDLYFYLRALRVRVPPLRERVADLPSLVEALGPRLGCPPERYRAPELLSALAKRRWRGNVRELGNVLERLRLLGLDAALAEGDDFRRRRWRTHSDGGAPSSTGATSSWRASSTSTSCACCAITTAT